MIGEAGSNRRVCRIGDVPDEYGAVAASGERGPSVGADGDHIDGARVAGEDGPAGGVAGIGEVPYDRDTHIIAGESGPAIRAGSYRVHVVGKGGPEGTAGGAALDPCESGIAADDGGMPVRADSPSDHVASAGRAEVRGPPDRMSGAPEIPP